MKRIVRTPNLILGLAVVLLCLIFTPTVLWLWQRWTLSIWHNGHGLFVPFVVAFMIFDRLRLDPVERSESSVHGFWLLLPALGLRVIDSAIQTDLLSAVALVLCLPGLSLLLLGARRTKSLAFAWVIAFFMLPIPAVFLGSLQFWLRRIAALGSEVVLSWLQVPVFRDQSTLHLARDSLLIADACSGFSTLYAAVTFALILAYLTPVVRNRIVLIGLSVPLALGFNVLRCSALALMVQQWGIETLETPLHKLSGFLSFASVLGILMLLSHTPNSLSKTT